MRRVVRSSIDPPPSLGEGGAGPAELLKARAYQNDRRVGKKAFDYSSYKGADVSAALEKLFHGKCAYCETIYAASTSADIEHYRPKGAVAEDAGHTGYWWLAMAWENLLPSCIDCNRQRWQQLVVASTSLGVLANNSTLISVKSGKKDSFPIAVGGIRAVAESTDFSNERPLLLNPCEDDPAASLMFSFDPAFPVGLILPNGDNDQQVRGAVSIQVYGLNRLKLVQDRTRILRALEFLGDLVVELSSSIEELEAAGSSPRVISRLALLRDRTLFEMKTYTDDSSPYSSMAKSWLEKFKTRFLAA